MRFPKIKISLKKKHNKKVSMKKIIIEFSNSKNTAKKFLRSNRCGIFARYFWEFLKTFMTIFGKFFSRIQLRKRRKILKILIRILEGKSIFLRSKLLCGTLKKLRFYSRFFRTEKAFFFWVRFWQKIPQLFFESNLMMYFFLIFFNCFFRFFVF